jgi:tetratricopeptide (TPR) repeat protein
VQRLRSPRGVPASALLAVLLCACGPPQHAQLARVRGDLALRIGEVADAADAYRQALAADPRDPDALLGMARCHVALGDGEAALDLFERLEAADPAYFASRAATDYHFALYQAAKQALRQGDSALALRRVRRLRSLDPDHGGLDTLETDVLILEGGRLQVAGRPEAGEALFREAMGRGTPGAEREATAALARALLERGRTDRAISILSDALLRHPGDRELQALMDGALEIRYPQ